MNIGLIGLGKMGLGFAERLIDAGYTVYGYDTAVESQNSFAAQGGKSVPLGELPAHTQIIIILLPAGAAVADAIQQLQKNATANTIIIDAGNSHFSDSVKHYEELKKNSIQFLDCGTSGGILGAETGYSLTIGGDKKTFDACKICLKPLHNLKGMCMLAPLALAIMLKWCIMASNMVCWKPMQKALISLNMAIIKNWILLLSRTRGRRCNNFFAAACII